MTRMEEVVEGQAVIAIVMVVATGTRTRSVAGTEAMKVKDESTTVMVEAVGVDMIVGTTMTSMEAGMTSMPGMSVAVVDMETATRETTMVDLEEAMREVMSIIMTTMVVESTLIIVDGVEVLRGITTVEDAIGKVDSISLKCDDLYQLLMYYARIQV